MEARLKAGTEGGQWQYREAVAISASEFSGEGK